MNIISLDLLASLLEGGVDLKDYKRTYPLFSLCGLNCGLCPRYQAMGDSKCPGCGGEDFHLKHPTCAVITCNKKHDNVEYCYQCSSFPCKKYERVSEVDSFISYQNVLADFYRVKQFGLGHYQSELNEKVEILEFLINHYNDGRRKGFYCQAVNLLELKDLKEIIADINNTIGTQDCGKKEKIEQILRLFASKAAQAGIELKLRVPVSRIRD